MAAVQVVPGFSLTNRMLLYTSTLLAPAQATSGVNNNCPSNFGFLAYNIYNQVQLYRATKSKQLHALSLLPTCFNFFFAISYIGGVTSGNIVFAAILYLGTAGALILNCVTAWTSWLTNLPEGIEVYQFFFLGWRTLSPGWRTFMLLWQIADTIAIIGWTGVAVRVIKKSFPQEHIQPAADPYSIEAVIGPQRISKYIMIPVGAISMLGVVWLEVLWTELIVARNHIHSDTDWIAVWLFIAQVGTLLLPSSNTFLGCLGVGSSIDDDMELWSF